MGIKVWFLNQFFVLNPKNMFFTRLKLIKPLSTYRFSIDVKNTCLSIHSRYGENFRKITYRLTLQRLFSCSADQPRSEKNIEKPGKRSSAILRYWHLTKTHVLLKCSRTENSHKMSSDHRFPADVGRDEDQVLSSQVNV